jgi:glucokinase
VRYVAAVRVRYLAIDLGATRLAAGVVDAAGSVVVRDRVATPTRNVWPTLLGLVRRVLAAAPDDEPPVACGVSCLPPIDHHAGRLTPLHMPTWVGFPLRDELQGATGLPVSIDSLGRSLALAETWCGAAVDRRDVLAVYAGDVVDAGVIANGRLLQGRTGNVGQIGHLVVEPGGLPCSCGGDGCLDAYVSAGAIETDTNRPLRRTPVAIIERSGIMLGRAIASMAAMVDCSTVVVGGSVPTIFGAPMFEAMTRELEQRSRLSHLLDLEVIPVGMGTGGPLVSAAAVARAASVTH